MALISKLRANKVCPDEYWEATVLARIRKDRALYASFADKAPSNLTRPVRPTRKRGVAKRRAARRLTRKQIKRKARSAARSVLYHAGKDLVIMSSGESMLSEGPDRDANAVRVDGSVLPSSSSSPPP